MRAICVVTHSSRGFWCRPDHYSYLTKRLHEKILPDCYPGKKSACYQASAFSLFLQFKSLYEYLNGL